MFGNFFGYNIIAVPYMSDIVQARTHKKRRINKKWRKRYGMKEIPWNKFYIEGNNIYCHPKMIGMIKKNLIYKE